MTEEAGCEGHITEDEVQDSLKSVGLDKFPLVDGLPHEVYLRLSHMFVPLLATIYNNWMRQGSISFWISPRPLIGLTTVF